MNSQLGLKSQLALPTDLRELFSSLEFRSDAGAYSVGLSQHGDGIKVRHIPIILHWMAQQANHKTIAVAGRPRVETIWGYEEPENNLEARNAFEVAKYLLQLQDEGIQIFLTTHSPIFYSELLQSGQRKVCLFEIQQAQNHGSAILKRNPDKSEDIEALDGSVGFMRLIQPYIRTWKERIDSLEQRIHQLIDTSIPTIFVEGPSDQEILQALLKMQSDRANISVLCATQNGGGHSWVRDSLIAWHYSRANAYAVGLFDSDRAAQNSYDEFRMNISDACSGKTKARAIKIPFVGIALDIKKHKIQLETAIEEICPREAWEHAHKNDWCELRPNILQVYGFKETNRTFNEWLSEQIPDDSLRFVAQYRIKSDFKERFSKFVAKQIEESAPYDFSPLRKLRDELLQKLNLE